MKPAALNALKVIISEFDAPICPACDEELADNDGLCKRCRDSLPFLTPPFCRDCGGENYGILEICPECVARGPSPWACALSIMKMENLGRELVHKLKYAGETSVAKVFGHLCADKWKREGMHVDGVVAMPAHPVRSLARGFNQVDLITAVFAKETHLPVIRPIRRVRATPRQARLNREARLRNLKNAFAPKRRAPASGRILLIDDVMTTGATMMAASQAILDAGAREVVAMSILRAV